MVDVGSAVGYLDLDISGFLNGLRNAQTEAQTTTSSLTDKLDSIGSKLTSTGTKLTATITAPIIGIGTSSVKTAANFESAMSKVSAISGATGNDLVKLNEKAKEMGAATKFSATESAEAFQYMAMAGWDTQAMLDGISGIMNLAAADGLDLATTSDIVTDALTAFGLKAEDSGHFADVLATASSAANTNVSMLGESFKYVAPLAGTMGYSVEDTATALGLMANSGIKASQAGTTLRSALSRLANPTEAVAAALQKYNIVQTETTKVVDSEKLKKAQKTYEKNMLAQYQAQNKFNTVVEKYGENSYEATVAQEKLRQANDALRESTENLQREQEGTAESTTVVSDVLTDENGNMRSLTDVLKLFRENMKGLSEDEQAQAASAIFGQQAMSGMLAIINASDEDFENLANSIGNADGRAQEMADTMLNNLNGQITILKSQLEGLAIQIGNALMPVVKSIVERIQSFAEWLSNLSQEQQEMVIKIGLVVAAIGPLLIIIGTLISKVSSTIDIYTKLATNITTRLVPAISGISAPVLAIVAVIGILIAAFVNLWKNNEEFREKILALWEKLKQVFSEFIKSFVDKIKELKEKTEPIIEKIKIIWNKFCEFLAPIFEGAFAQVINILKTVFDAILDVLDIFISVFSGDWEGALNAVKKLFSNIWDNIKKIFKTTVDTIKDAANVFFGWFGTSWDEVWTGIKNFFVEIWDKIIEFFSGIKDKFAGLLGSIKNAFSEAWDVIKIIWDKVSPYFEKIWEFIKGTFKEVPNTLSNFFNKAREAIEKIWDAVGPYFEKVWKAIKFVFSVVVDFFKMIFENAWIAIKTVWNVVIDFFKGIWDGIALVFSVVKGVLTGDFSDAWESVKRVFGTTIEFFSDLWNGIKRIFGNVFEFFRDTFSRGFDAIKDVFSGIGNFFKDVWETVSDKARDGMNWFMGRIEDSLNRAIDFLNRWGFELPNGDWFGLAINYVNLPRLEKGGILKKGQVGLLEGNGSEAVVPLEKNLGWIKQIAKGVSQYMIADITPLFNLLSAYHDVSRSMLAAVNSVAEKQNETFKDTPSGGGYRGGGNTYNFYSPKPIDEYEAKRQMEKAERDLAEGYYI